MLSSDAELLHGPGDFQSWAISPGGLCCTPGQPECGAPPLGPQHPVFPLVLLTTWDSGRGLHGHRGDSAKEAWLPLGLLSILQLHHSPSLRRPSGDACLRNKWHLESSFGHLPRVPGIPVTPSPEHLRRTMRAAMASPSFTRQETDAQTRQGLDRSSRGFSL